MRLGGKFVVAVSVVAAAVVSGVVPVSGSGPEPFKLPPRASEVAQGVFFLGTAVQDGLVVDGYAISTTRDAIRGRSANARAPKPGGGGGTTVESCYSFIAGGARWRTVENYEVGPDSLGVGALIPLAFSAWESASGGKNFVGTIASATASVFTADTAAPDTRNEVYSGPVADPGVLGYTIVWSTRGFGRTPGSIVEADMVIDNDGDWTWGVGGFDLNTVVGHEAGHWVGLGHTTTTSTCAAQLMYPSVAPGETKVIGAGDTAGIIALYK